MNITVTLKPGMVFARGNDFVELVGENGETSYIVHFFSIDKKYDGAGYMTLDEIEKWIDKNGFWYGVNMSFPFGDED